MDTQQLDAFQKIVAREIAHVNQNIDVKFESVLRGVAVLGDQIKDFELRMRQLEMQNSSTIVQIQNEIGHVKGGLVRLEGDLGEVTQKYNDWMKYFKAQQDETIAYSKEIFISQEDFEEYKEKIQERWEEQSKTNEKNNGMRVAAWTVVVIVLGLVVTFIFDIVTHGGVYGLVQSWGLSVP